MTTIGFTNNYPMTEARRLHDLGRYPGQHLWGTLALEAAGFDVRLIDGATSSRLPARLGRGAAGATVDQLGALVARDYDLLYGASGAGLGVLGTLRSAVRIGPPLLAVIHPGLPGRRLQRAAASGYDAVIALSREVERDLVGRLGRDPARTFVLPWGPDLAFPGYRSTGDDFVVQSGKTRRDTDTLLRALGETGIPARVYIDDSRRSGVYGRTEIVGHSSYDCVLADLQRAAIVAVPLFDDGVLAGLTEINDALALGKPMVVTRCRMLDLDVEAIGCGIVVEPGDVAGWTAALRRLWDDAELRASMGATGRRFAETEWNADRFGSRLVDLARRLVGSDERSTSSGTGC